ncbi:MAG TPA: L-threonylcarbamoyladenylate synthase [Acidimicrobiia bacterium]|nr:L-threonylcarbamoyladenylate synthase [Acidimicrobiia bacterium]
MTIEAAVEAIRKGGVVGFPTDTVYGIGVDPLNPRAVARLFEMKGRPMGKPVGLLVASLEQAMEIGELGPGVEALALRHWPGALTVVVTPKVILSDWVGDTQERTVGLRVPDHPTALDLLAQTGPLAVTSANRSGGPEATTAAGARSVFGEQVAVYLPGEAPGGEASTVIDATGDDLVVLRQGPVSV